ncbi:MAG: 23S rRNA (guanosine(2251)-2'-O)-methyltransferase RlmB [Deltaproteobacteria bacterium]|nr:23S rRNA (guanosine(2251)-2'-O)-methyltransferase RlmB [Deltaproteobacteria bacterium]
MTDLIAGINPVFEALKERPDQINQIVAAAERRDERLHKIIELARLNHIKVATLPRRMMDQKYPEILHQGVVALVAPYQYVGMEDVLSRASAAPGPFALLALDGITDPHNLGALIRTAAAAQVQAVIVTTHRSTLITPTVQKTAAGALAHVSVVRAPNLAQSLQQLKDSGFWIYGATVQNGVDYRATDYAERMVLVLGSEDKGLRPLIAKTCDYLVTIPLNPKVPSLNVSVAGGVLMFEMAKRWSPPSGINVS